MAQTFAWQNHIQSAITVINLIKVGTDMRLVCVPRQATFAGGVGHTHLEIGMTT